jgi:hypothetical protein
VFMSSCLVLINLGKRERSWIADAHCGDEKLAALWNWKRRFTKMALTLSASGGQDCTRAKSVGRLSESST